MKQKKMIRGMLSILLVLFMVAGMAPAAMAADGSVEFKGQADKFVFFPGDPTGSNLFDNFSGVMPGDSISQPVKITNKSNATVKIYIKAVAHNDDNKLSEYVANHPEDVVSMEKFLSKLSMTVKQGDKTLFEAAPNKLGGLQENVLLGTFAPGSGTTLDVTLNVPITLGNKYANRAGEVDWVFTAEEVEQGGGGDGPFNPGDRDDDGDDEDIDDPDVPKGDADVPGDGDNGDGSDGDNGILIPGTKIPLKNLPHLVQTGDAAPILAFLLLLVAGGAGLVYTRKKLS